MNDMVYQHLILFRGLPEDQAGLIRRVFQPLVAPAGEVLFAQGDPAEYLYVLVEGEVHIRYKPDDGQPILLTRVHSGGVVGWSAALGNPAYTSSVVCETNCLLLRTRAGDLRTLCAQYPETGGVILDRLAAVVAERLHITHQNVLSLLEQGMRLPARSAAQD